MARPDDIARAKSYLDALRNDAAPAPIDTSPSESIFTTRARRLERTRRNAVLGLKHGDTEPLASYREELRMYKAYLHLGNHLGAWEA